MVWLIIGLAAILTLCLGGGLAYGGYTAAQSPLFWGRVVAAAWQALSPALADLVRSSQATREAAMRAAREGRMGDPHAGREK